jgi:hypothetical protein
MKQQSLKKRLAIAALASVASIAWLLLVVLVPSAVA